MKTKLTGIYTFTFSLLCETIHGFETKTVRFLSPPVRNSLVFLSVLLTLFFHRVLSTLFITIPCVFSHNIQNYNPFFLLAVASPNFMFSPCVMLHTKITIPWFSLVAANQGFYLPVFIFHMTKKMVNVFFKTYIKKKLMLYFAHAPIKLP